MNERPIPDAARRDPNSVEMLRVWIAERTLNCSMKIGMYESLGKDEPAAWGVILADVAKHVANATESRSNREYEEVLVSISAAFITELEKSTSLATGYFRGH